MVLGIIGAVIGIPGAVCSGACAAGLSGAAGRGDATQVGNFYLALGLITAFGGLLGGTLARRSPVFAGILMILSGSWADHLIAGNMLALITTVLFIVGGAIALANKSKLAPGTAARQQAAVQPPA
jgi:hypothetical protein